MSATHIDYDDLVQQALRNVVRDILSDAAENGVPGDHHFYIAFRTRAPGVSLPEHLKQRYPEEMTVVLQHKFWDLSVHPDRFEVGLSFNQKPEHLVIPFAAIVGFVDPSVQFALQFEDPDLDDKTLPNKGEAEEKDAGEPADDPPADAPAQDNGDNVVTLDAFRKKP